MGGILVKDSGVDLVVCADGLVRREAAQSLESASVIISQQESLQVLIELGSGLIMIAQHGGFFNRSIHALNLTIGPWVSRLGEAMLNAVLSTNTVKDVLKGPALMRHIAELGTVVS